MKLIPRSFCSERTVEYFLVSHFSTILKSSFDVIIPMHFSSTREGNKTSLFANCELSGRLLVVFARRPKVTSNDNNITFKINYELILFAEQARILGIPVLAGYPLARSITQLNNAEFIYSKIDQEVSEEQSFILEKNDDSWNRNTVPSLINCSQIGIFISESSAYLNWEPVQDTLKNLKTNLRYSDSMFYFFRGFGRYTPLFFLLGNEGGQELLTKKSS